MKTPQETVDKLIAGGELLGDARERYAQAMGRYVASFEALQAAKAEADRLFHEGLQLVFAATQEYQAATTVQMAAFDALATIANQCVFDEIAQVISPRFDN